MVFELPNLPYCHEALEPVISAATLAIYPREGQSQ